MTGCPDLDPNCYFWVTAVVSLRGEPDDDDEEDGESDDKEENEDENDDDADTGYSE